MEYLGYADAWEAYEAKGWAPIPIPPEQKSPVPVGFTGADHNVPGIGQMKIWARNRPDWNLALVMPENVIVIDVDALDGKPGLRNLGALVRRLGPLPRTAYSTRALPNHGHGHYYYTVPAGTKLIHKAAEGIDILQYHHRYAVEWPSINGYGDLYKWYHQDPEHEDGEIPDVNELPALPEKWLDFLMDTTERTGRGYDGGVEDWLDDLPVNALSRVYQEEHLRKVREISLAEGSRHDTVKTHVNRLVHLGAEGWDVREPLAELEMTFISALDGERNAEREFNSMLRWAIDNFGEAEDD